VRLGDRRRARCLAAAAADGERTDADGRRQDRRGATARRYLPPHTPGARRDRCGLHTYHTTKPHVSHAAALLSAALGWARSGEAPKGFVLVARRHAGSSRRPYEPLYGFLPRSLRCLGVEVPCALRVGGIRPSRVAEMRLISRGERLETSQRPWWRPPW
jgi:hypothetical protein